jgi:hypothetical protein
VALLDLAETPQFASKPSNDLIVDSHLRADGYSSRIRMGAARVLCAAAPRSTTLTHAADHPGDT